jgi:uncharacterized membrane protein YraQ (UPF0718 family)
MPLIQITRFIHLIRLSVLGAAILTCAYIVLIFGWQLFTFMEQGTWPALTVSSALDLLNQNHAHSYLTQATRSIRNPDASGLKDILLQLPAVMPLVIAAILLAAFYTCLSRIERRSPSS